MSVTSTDSNKLSDHSYLLKRYAYYKSTCKELIQQNEELYQKLHTTKNKLELKTLELNDATNAIEDKTKELEHMVIEMGHLKKNLVEKVKEIALINHDNAIFSKEIIQLKTQLNDLSLQNNAKLLALEKINLTKEVSKEADHKNPGNGESSKIDKKCDSWWCPKHSNLAMVYKKLDIKTLNDKLEIDQAMNRQRYWSRQGEIRCCVFDRKSGVDKKHANPPRCWINYNSVVTNKVDVIEQKINSLSIDVSSDEEL